MSADIVYPFRFKARAEKMITCGAGVWTAASRRLRPGIEENTGAQNKAHKKHDLEGFPKRTYMMCAISRLRQDCHPTCVDGALRAAAKAPVRTLKNKRRFARVMGSGKILSARTEEGRTTLAIPRLISQFYDKIKSRWGPLPTASCGPLKCYTIKVCAAKNRPKHYRNTVLPNLF